MSDFPNVTEVMIRYRHDPPTLWIEYLGEDGHVPLDNRKFVLGPEDFVVSIPIETGEQRVD